MSYRAILVPVGQADDAASAIETAFLVAKRFAGHVRAQHVLPDLANPAIHGLIATRMSLDAATSDLRKLKASAASGGMPAARRRAYGAVASGRSRLCRAQSTIRS